MQTVTTTITSIQEACSLSALSLEARLPNDLWHYARQRLTAGEGQEVFAALGIDADLAESLGAGYVPENFREALSPEQAGLLSGRSLANCVLLPAHDDAGQVVDCLAVWSQGAQGVQQATLLGQPQGLLCARVCKAYQQIVMTDSFAVLARLWSLGLKNVVLVRGLKDLRNIGPRLHISGVRSAKLVLWRQALTNPALRLLPKAGIEATKTPAILQLDRLDWLWVERVLGVKAMRPEEQEIQEVPHLKLLTHDSRACRATFQSPDGALYTSETAPDCGSKLEVKIEHEGHAHLDRFDLSAAAQRRRYAQSAALRTKVPFEQIENDLVLILDAVRRLQVEAVDPNAAAAKVHISDAERAEAIAYLKRPDLLEAIIADLGALGWVGEEDLKRQLWLISISRKLADPLHGALRSGPGSGKTMAMNTICSATPPEDVVTLSNLTGAALFHQGDSLRHKLLALSESDLLEREVIVLLRVLLSDGFLRRAGTQRDEATGRVVAAFHEAQGPVAFLTATTRDLDSEVLDRCFDLPSDETEEQTKRIIEAQQKACLDPSARVDRDKVLARLRNVQRLIVPAQVRIPYADRIEFKAAGLAQRRQHQRLLRLIMASALLHQHQRLREGEFLVASEADFEIARDLIVPAGGTVSQELSRNAQDALELARTARLASFCLADLKALRPAWTRHKIYSGLEELTRVEILTSTKGRGKVRTYALQAESLPAVSHVVALRPEGELLKLSGGPDNKFTPSAATG